MVRVYKRKAFEPSSGTIRRFDLEHTPCSCEGERSIQVRSIAVTQVFWWRETAHTTWHSCVCCHIVWTATPSPEFRGTSGYNTCTKKSIRVREEWPEGADVEPPSAEFRPYQAPKTMAEVSLERAGKKEWRPGMTGKRYRRNGETRPLRRPTDDPSAEN